MVSIGSFDYLTNINWNGDILVDSCGVQLYAYTKEFMFFFQSPFWVFSKVPNISNKVRLNLSGPAFPWVWYIEVCVLFICVRWHKSLIKSDSKLVPWSILWLSCFSFLSLSTVVLKQRYQETCSWAFCKNCSPDWLLHSCNNSNKILVPKITGVLEAYLVLGATKDKQACSCDRRRPLCILKSTSMHHRCGKDWPSAHSM